MAPMGTFCFVFLILRNPPTEIGQIIKIYVTQCVLTNARLGFLQGGQKPQFSATISTTFGIGGLLLQNWEEYGKSKIIGFIIDYLTIFTSNLVGVG